MAAYIDLNPVRAKMVEEPEDYRWCGYAEALSGSKEARQGLCRVMGAEEACWSKPVAAGYGQRGGVVPRDFVWRRDDAHGQRRPGHPEWIQRGAITRGDQRPGRQVEQVRS